MPAKPQPPTRPRAGHGYAAQMTERTMRTKGAKSAKPNRNRNRNQSAKPPAVARREREQP